MHLIGDTFDDLYRGILHRLLTRPDHRPAPRGQGTREVLGASLKLLDSRRNLLRSPARNLNISFQVAEWLWIRGGRNDVATIKAFNKQLALYSDDGVTLSGAYGPKVQEQLPYVLEQLRLDPDTRQAVMTIWTPRPRASKDIPCTVALQFLRRQDKIDLVVFMRSNDAWLGLPYDVFTFTQLQAEVAAILGCTPGQYHHHVGSLHLYDQHADQAYAVVREQVDVPVVASPLLPGPVPNALETRLPHWAVNPWQEERITRYATKIRGGHSVLGGETDSPVWEMYAKVLLYRWHKDKSLLPPLYRDLLT